MTKILIAVKDDGATVKVDQVSTINLPGDSSTNSNLQEFIQFQVNGQYLDPHQSSNYFTRLTQYNPTIVISDANKRFLQQALIQSFPRTAYSAQPLHWNATTVKQIPSALPSHDMGSVMRDVFGVMEHYTYETLTGMAGEYVDYRASMQQLLRSKNNQQLGNRAFRRFNLTKLCDRELTHLVLGASEKFTLYGGMLHEFSEGIHEFEEMHPHQTIGYWDMAEIGGEIGLKNYAFVKMYNSPHFAKAVAAAEAATYRVLTWVTTRVGIGALHPLVATGITLLTVNYLAYKLLEPVWERIKIVPGALGDIWQRSDSCYAQSAPQSKPWARAIVLQNSSLPTTSLGQIPRSVVMSTEDSKVDITLTPSQNFNSSLYPTMGGGFGSKEPLAPFKTQKADVEQFQQSLREFLARQTSKHQYFFDVDPRVFLPEDTAPQYAPGERGSI